VEQAPAEPGQTEQAPAEQGQARVSLSSALAGSLLAVLAHPSWWVLALAGFLVRGGLLVLLLPLIPLPTTAGLANAVGPMLVGFVFGGPSPAFLLLFGAAVAALTLWLVLGGALGVATDLALIRRAAADEELGEGEPPTRGGTWRALLVRWLAHLPTTAILLWGAARLVDAAYAELISPGDAGLPVPIRVLLRVPLVVGLLLATWLAGEAIGGLAVRYMAAGSGSRAALAQALMAIARPSGLAVLVMTHAALAVALVVGGMATWAAAEHARIVLLDGAARPTQWIALGLLSAGWLGTLWLVALAAAWRSAAWTWEVRRRTTAATASAT